MAHRHQGQTELRRWLFSLDRKNMYRNYMTLCCIDDLKLIDYVTYIDISIENVYLYLFYERISEKTENSQVRNSFFLQL